MLVVILSRCTLWVSLKLHPSAPQKKGAELLSRHQTWSQRWAECRWHPCLLPQTIAVSVKTWGKHGKPHWNILGSWSTNKNEIMYQCSTLPARSGRGEPGYHVGNHLSCATVWQWFVSWGLGILFCNSNHKARIWRYFPPPTVITQMMILILMATHLVPRTTCLLSLPLVHICINIYIYITHLQKVPVMYVLESPSPNTECPLCGPQN